VRGEEVQQTQQYKKDTKDTYSNYSEDVKNIVKGNKFLEQDRLAQQLRNSQKLFDSARAVPTMSG
jgi:hypothetical protein